MSSGRSFFFNWRGVAIVLAVLGAVVASCAAYFVCCGKDGADPRIVRIRGELAEGKRAMRQQEAENLARLAREFRVLAKRYRENGENRKAQRAIGAAQELDKKIARLLEGN